MGPHDGPPQNFPPGPPPQGYQMGPPQGIRPPGPPPSNMGQQMMHRPPLPPQQ
jgi:hypothetical protein